MVKTRVFPGMAIVIAGCALGCIQMPAATGPATAAAPEKKEERTTVEPFKLKAEWDGPCARAEAVDVNLGGAPATFVRAAHCQITGQEPPAALVTKWTERMRDEYYVRRIDVVRSLCAASKRECKLAYSDPWVDEPDLGGPPERHTKREIGAVLMFFFDCPGKTNCSMDWANTHAPGMDGPVPSLGMKPGESAPFHPSQPGFWRRELSDAKYAGLSFLMPNAYGPDMEDGKLKPLSDALKSMDAPIKLALFDDTWTWASRSSVTSGSTSPTSPTPTSPRRRSTSTSGSRSSRRSTKNTGTAFTVGRSSISTTRARSSRAAARRPSSRSSRRSSRPT